MEAAAAAKSAACAATGVPASTAAYVAMSAAGISAACIAAASAVAVSATVAVSAVPAIATPAAPAPSVPRPRADEHAAVEPIRTVITVRGTSIGVILVIAPRAIWRAVVADISRINHHGADADSYPDLGVRWDSCKR
jgi:hypothetical protein